jgi:hypothetical protein
MMQKITLLFLLFVSIVSSSQEKRICEKEVFEISKRIELIIATQKDSLKIKLVSIDIRSEKGEITEVTANALKREVAAYHAKQIEMMVGE